MYRVVLDLGGMGPQHLGMRPTLPEAVSLAVKNPREVWGAQPGFYTFYRIMPDGSEVEVPVEAYSFRDPIGRDEAERIVKDHEAEVNQREFWKERETSYRKALHAMYGVDFEEPREEKIVKVMSHGGVWSWRPLEAMEDGELGQERFVPKWGDRHIYMNRQGDTLTLAKDQASAYLTGMPVQLELLSTGGHGRPTKQRYYVQSNGLYEVAWGFSPYDVVSWSRPGRDSSLDGIIE